jgi:flagellar motor protein MotB
LAVAGCTGPNSMIAQGQLQKAEQQQLALSNQAKELQNRARDLDRDNQELDKLVAQARQQNLVLQQQLTALRDQLKDVTGQLQQVREEKLSTEQQVQALTASLRRRGGATITPNNSLLESMPTIDLPGVEVRRDGDVIRVELPAKQLFQPGTTQLLPGGARLIVTVGTDLAANYPNHIIGVEGHTDSDPVVGGPWRNNHHLSLARAVAVYEVLVNQTRTRPEQVSIVGHGANHPVVSNGAAAGKERNRRVELVVYPERG